ncbi:hypothetical protein FA95DRAFT_410587 [Auriscalpium vulgare]|uniref:Uncharacterized protein n=1 Tax=Auriscalpium vulgare TaxID=40419 RepID=A0ACB8RI16_9AGAM|nr:hypothetical protein FA95DRAFT_410587 [Auriscalpium vulgare]
MTRFSALARRIHLPTMIITINGVAADTGPGGLVAGAAQRRHYAIIQLELRRSGPPSYTRHLAINQDRYHIKELDKQRHLLLTHPRHPRDPNHPSTMSDPVSFAAADDFSGVKFSLSLDDWGTPGLRKPFLQVPDWDSNGRYWSVPNEFGVMESMGCPALDFRVVRTGRLRIKLFDSKSKRARWLETRTALKRAVTHIPDENLKQIVRVVGPVKTGYISQKRLDGPPLLFCAALMPSTFGVLVKHISPSYVQQARQIPIGEIARALHMFSVAAHYYEGIAFTGLCPEHMILPWDEKTCLRNDSAPRAFSKHVVLMDWEKMTSHGDGRTHNFQNAHTEHIISIYMAPFT